MKAADFLVAARCLPTRSLTEVTRQRGIVVIAPHPDDESLGCGGLICQAVDSGLLVRIIFVSDGTGSHPNSAAYPPRILRGLRQQEATAAAAKLGLDRDALIFLNLPDRYVPVNGPLADWAIGVIGQTIADAQAYSVFVTWDEDPHCDHAAAYQLAYNAIISLPAVTLYAYPTWSWLKINSDEIGYAPKGFRLAISAQLDRKRQAIMQHRTQTSSLIQDDPTGFTIPSEFLETMLQPYETFLETSAR